MDNTARVDDGWVLEQLERFVDAASPQHDGRGNWLPKGGREAVVDQVDTVERILDRFYKGWREMKPQSVRYEWHGHEEMARRCLSRLLRESEVQAALGDGAPTFSASALHPWVWDGARSLWNSGHFREAVEAAAKSLNARTQNKVDRRNLAEADLFAQAFSDDEPKSDMPRLRPVGTEGDGKTARSLRRGIRDYASGCYAAIRNPKAHDDPSVDTPEQEALEQLAALSVLARWVDSADVRTTG